MESTMCTQNPRPIEQQTGPGKPTPEHELPHALVFFLSRGQRRAVLRALRELHPTRETALLRLLGVDR